MSNLHTGRLLAWIFIAAGACGLAYALAGGFAAAFGALLVIGLLLLWMESY